MENIIKYFLFFLLNMYGIFPNYIERGEKYKVTFQIFCSEWKTVLKQSK